MGRSQLNNMKKLIPLIVLLFFAFSAHGAEPVKRQTAQEIYTTLLQFPYGVDINQITSRMGTPTTQGDDFVGYRHSRTGTYLVLWKTPFNTVQATAIVEECASAEDAEARRVLITEQFKRRFGKPLGEEKSVAVWSITGVGTLAVHIHTQHDYIVVYRVDSSPGK